MFVDQNGKRVNVYAQYEHAGVRYPNLLSPTTRDIVGVVEVAEPLPPEDYDEIRYIRSEVDDAPYVVYSPRPTEDVMASLVKIYEQELDSHMDRVAQQYRYDTRFTFALRAGYAGPYQAEGIAFASWMDQCNAQAYTLMDQVLSGQVTLPSIEDFIASLPTFTMPE